MIPAFNVAPFLHECIESVATQAVFDRCEVIVVDDGSTDSTGDLADSAAARWPQVRVIHQANRGPGPGAARNAGLREAGGDFVLFLDGDDALAPDGLDLLYQAACERSADLVVGSLESFPDRKRYPWDDLFASLADVRTCPVEDAASLIHNPAPGNKLIRRRALQRFRLTFAEWIHHQDTYVSIPLMLKLRTVTLVPQVVQRYRRRPGSIMDAHFSRTENYFDHLQVVEHLSMLRAELATPRRDVLDAFLVRSMQGFVLRASDLPPERVSEFVARAARVYAAVPASAYPTATASLNHRLAYRALIDGDLAALSASREPVRHVYAHEGHLYAGAPRDGTTPDPLTRAGALIATLDTLEADDRDSVAVAGTVRVKGIAPVHELGVAVSLRLKGAGLTLPATVMPDPDPRETRWSVRLAISDVPSGTFEARIVIDTTTGQVSSAIRDFGQALEAMVANCRLQIAGPRFARTLARDRRADDAADVRDGCR